MENNDKITLELNDKNEVFLPNSLALPNSGKVLILLSHDFNKDVAYCKNVNQSKCGGFVYFMVDYPNTVIGEYVKNLKNIEYSYGYRIIKSYTANNIEMIEEFILYEISILA